jgi:hypothetical protein
VVEVTEPRVIEGGHDQQHGIRARRARLPELVVVEDEVLSEQRKLDGRARGDEVTESATKVFLVGEHGDRRRAGPGVDARLRCWIEGGVEGAPGGRGFLHLRDEPHTPRRRGSQRGLELPRGPESAAGRL